MSYALNGMTHIFASDSGICHAEPELCTPTWCVKCCHQAAGTEEPEV